MTSYEEKQEQRDSALARRSASAADDFSLYLRTWIQEEIIALYPGANELAGSTAPQPLKREYEQARQALQELDNHELNDVYDIFKDKLVDIQDGSYENGLDAHQYVQDALSGLERVVRRLLRIRREIDFWMQQPAAGEQTENESGEEVEGGEGA